MQLIRQRFTQSDFLVEESELKNETFSSQSWILILFLKIDGTKNRIKPITTKVASQAL